MLVYPFRKIATIGFSATALLTFALSAQASNIIVNGSFESTTNGTGQFDNNTTVTGWTSAGYNFIFGAGTGDTTGSVGEFGGLSLWGPNNGSANGLPATSPDGGNYVAADGAFEVAPIQQTVNGLTPGISYDLTFYWAGAQQEGFHGSNTEQWQVSLGAETHSTVVVNNADMGFTGWQQQTFTFTPTNSSELLSFLAVGTPNGVPPFSLLDGVSLNVSAPEPGALTLTLGVLLSGLGVLRVKSRRKS